MSTYPTGSLSIVAAHMEQAREAEGLIAGMVKNEAYHTAIDLYCEAEKSKQKAAIEMLLWMIAVLAMPDEPNPWKELQEKKNGNRS